MIDLNLDFEKFHRLIPAVLQDADSDAVLMVGFMNREALAKTLETGCVTFLSRTRGRLWTKGETSGNFALVSSISTDCDRDALLLRVRVQGEGTICHRGTPTCFNEPIELSAAARQGALP
jgi:phosphoribosyl-AMP cyclohydrolase